MWLQLGYIRSVSLAPSAKSLQSWTDHNPQIISVSLEKESFLQTLCNRLFGCIILNMFFFFFTDFSFFFLFAVPFESCYAAKQAQQIKCHVKQKQAWKLPSGCTAHLAERAARGPDYPCQWKRKWDSGFCSVTACGHTPPFQGTIISGYLDFLFRGAKTHHI